MMSDLIEFLPTLTRRCNKSVGWTLCCGGCGAFAYLLHRGLTRLGYKVDILARDYEKDTVEELYDAGYYCVPDHIVLRLTDGDRTVIVDGVGVTEDGWYEFMEGTIDPKWLRKVAIQEPQNYDWNNMFRDECDKNIPRLRRLINKGLREWRGTKIAGKGAAADAR